MLYTCSPRSRNTCFNIRVNAYAYRFLKHDFWNSYVCERLGPWFCRQILVNLSRVRFALPAQHHLLLLRFFLLHNVSYTLCV